MAAETDLRNLWLSNTEHKALMQYLGGIEIGLFQLRQGRLPMASSDRQSLQFIEQGCAGIRQILDILQVLTVEGCPALAVPAAAEASSGPAS